jgi:Mg-chelatase subunit ChlD
MSLSSPVWLLLALPLALALWLWSRASLPVVVTRAVVLVLVLFAMAGLALRLPSRNGTVVVVADRSKSMPAGAEQAEREAIDLVQSAMSRDDRLAVVSFGESAVVEHPPQAGRFPGFTHQVGPDASDLSAAIDRALSLVPPDAPGRILVLSDGRFTGRAPAAAAALAAARQIAIDYRAIERPAGDDTAIEEVDAPIEVNPGEPLEITASIRAAREHEIGVELVRAGRTVAAGRARVAAGISRLTFRDQAGDPGTWSYVLRVTSSADDPIPENNTARFLVGIEGPLPLLVVTETRGGLARLIQAGGMKVQAAAPAQARWGLETLAGYGGIVLENVPADRLGRAAMENLAAWVRETGGGLMMTGGRTAYGPGGYFRSPLEPLMPVSMELRREHRKLALAVVVALDRSGSMAMPVAGGRTKMDLANVAAAEVADLLSPSDEFGVVAVDIAAHVVAPLAPLEKKEELRRAVLQIDSGGGGIFIFEALSAAARLLVDARPETRHILLFADAADSEEPGEYRELLEKCRQANITVSVVGLGKPTDSDAELLRDIAARGQGEMFFTEDASELPRLFAADTFVVARSTFQEGPTPIRFTAGARTLTGKSWDAPPSAGGYNLCYLRPGANLAALSVDEYEAPIVAAWQAGIGRVVCYTGEADGPFTGAIAAWKNVGDFFSSLGRWTAGDRGALPDGMLLTQKVRAGVHTIELHLDPERTRSPAGLPRVTSLSGAPGVRPATRKLAMHWTSPDTLSAEVPLGGEQVSIGAVEIPQAGSFPLQPVRLPYSPELRPADPGAGAAVLDRIARVTGGRERVELASIWKELPRRPRSVDLRPWLLTAAIVLLLAEVLERRSGLLFAARGGRRPAKAPAPSPRPVPEPARQTKEAPAPPPHKEIPSALSDALRRARREARRRTGSGRPPD